MGYDFGARMYSAEIGRWMAADPADQFMSPYVGIGNDPVNGYDPDGGIYYDKPPPPESYDEVQSRFMDNTGSSGGIITQGDLLTRKSAIYGTGWTKTLGPSTIADTHKKYTGPEGSYWVKNSNIITDPGKIEELLEGLKYIINGYKQSSISVESLILGEIDGVSFNGESIKGLPVYEEEFIQGGDQNCNENIRTH